MCHFFTVTAVAVAVVAAAVPIMVAAIATAGCLLNGNVEQNEAEKYLTVIRLAQFKLINKYT